MKDDEIPTFSGAWWKQFQADFDLTTDQVEMLRLESLEWSETPPIWDKAKSVQVRNRSKFARISKSLKNAHAALAELDAVALNFLAEEARFEENETHFDYGGGIDEVTLEIIHRYDTTVLTRYELLHILSSVGRIADRGAHMTGNDLTRDRALLRWVSGLQFIWERDLDREFSRSFHHSEPVNGASRFVVAMTHAIDPSVKISRIELAMKTCIQRYKKRAG